MTRCKVVCNVWKVKKKCNWVDEDHGSNFCSGGRVLNEMCGDHRAVGMATKDYFVEAMALKDHINLTAHLISSRHGLGDAEANGHEFDRNDTDLAILGCKWIVFVDLG